MLCEVGDIGLPHLCGMNISEYRSTPAERERTADLVRLLPKNRSSVLDIGARDGYFSEILKKHFQRVVALDLVKPSWKIPGVETVAGDATRLQFAENSFDCVFCAEVLEHIPDLEAACAEIVRVARHQVIIGVPYKQDIRVGQMSCRKCGKVTPPWGHVNTFDERKLQRLFRALRVDEISFVGKNREATNWLAAALMTMGGNPWGPYEQDEGCIDCGAKLTRPAPRPVWQRICSALALRLEHLHSALTREHGNWIHVRFVKRALS
ncbi:MAG TPA: class I SAM-dependent methyltransferase [Bryobacteraceae bacterium]|nr:class I SAM-dependent methyltransferase [Bryobacteraceae bacterium]